MMWESVLQPFSDSAGPDVPVAQSATVGAAPDSRRRAMAIRGFICQNVTIASSFGTFGVAIMALQTRYGVGAGAVTLALAAAVLVIGLASPLAAVLIGRIGMRRTMLSGIALSIAGYLLLARAPDFSVVVLAYAIPIGLGLALCGPLAASVLVGGWFRDNPGPALGFVNMPLLLMVLPLAAVPVLREYGLTGMFLGLAALHVLLVPVAWGVADPPVASGAHGAAPEVSARMILGRPLFWALALGAGLLQSASIFATAHLAAIGAERGLGAEQGALLVSVQGGASVVGAFGAGLLCARMGGARTLALLGGVMAAGWAMLVAGHALPGMALAAFLLGAAGAGVFPALNVVSAEAFGAMAVARVLGLLGLATLPFNFGLPPVAGGLRDAAGSYDPVALGIIAICAATAVLYLALGRRGPRIRHI